MSELHPFLQSFRDEHAAIKKDLNLLLDAENWSEFFSRARELVPPHEMREEKFLFAALATKIEIRAGGPMCMLYFDLHTSNPPLARAATICGQRQIQLGPKNVPAHLKEFFEENLPVCIPLQDHFALEQILNASVNASPADLSYLAVTYFSIMSLHFEKEDQCLLVMCSQIISDQEWDSWSKKAHCA